MYYDRLIGHASASSANLVQTGERIEDGLKTEKIKDYQMLFKQSHNGKACSMKNIFPYKELIKVKKRFIQCQAMHPDINSHMVIMLLFIIYLHDLLYFNISQPYHVPTTNGIPFQG